MEETLFDSSVESNPSPKKSKKGKGSSKISFKNKLRVPQTVGFKNRTVTWAPGEALELFPEEVAEGAFQRRIKDFKEVK